MGVECAGVRTPSDGHRLRAAAKERVLRSPAALSPGPAAPSSQHHFFFRRVDGGILPTLTLMLSSTDSRIAAAMAAEALAVKNALLAGVRARAGGVVAHDKEEASERAG